MFTMEYFIGFERMVQSLVRMSLLVFVCCFSLNTTNLIHVFDFILKITTK